MYMCMLHSEVAYQPLFLAERVLNVKGTQQRFDWNGQGSFGVMLINAEDLSGFSVTGGSMTSAVTVCVYEDGSAQMNVAMQAGCKLIVWAGFHSGSVPYVTYVLS